MIISKQSAISSYTTRYSTAQHNTPLVDRGSAKMNTEAVEHRSSLPSSTTSANSDPNDATRNHTTDTTSHQHTPADAPTPPGSAGGGGRDTPRYAHAAVDVAPRDANFANNANAATATPITPTSTSVPKTTLPPAPSLHRCSFALGPGRVARGKINIESGRCAFRGKVYRSVTDFAAAFKSALERQRQGNPTPS